MEPLQPQLQSLVDQIHWRGILYEEAMREFRKTFILVALRDQSGNQTRTARALRIHGNTLARHLTELGIRETAHRRRIPEKALAAA